MEAIENPNEPNWSERFKQMFEALNGPGSFTLDYGNQCPFCEDKDKIPVVINNTLSTEIKKMPLQIICEEAGLFGSQVREIMKAKAHNDYIVEKYYTEVFGKALALKQGNYFNSPNKPMPMEQVQMVTLQDLNPNNYFKINEVNNVQPKGIFETSTQGAINPGLQNVGQLEMIPELKVTNWDGTPSFDVWSLNAPQFSCNAEVWPAIDKRLYLPDDEREDDEEEIKLDFNPSDNKREVENLCRLKDPYLLAVNAAIFGNKDGNYPQEGTEDYYKAAQQCALFGVTFSDSEATSIRNNLTPRQVFRTPEVDVKDNDITITQGDRNAKVPITLQGNNRNPQQQKSKILNQTEPSTMNLGKNVFTPPIFCTANTSVNQFQPALVGLNISQKPKTPKFLPKNINFLTPQQILLQTAIQKNRQPANYPYTAPFQQALGQPQPLLYTNPLLTSPYLNACFKETHINTSIIQQQQYNFFGAGTYEMLIYAQMLQQTQTIISKNRAAARNLADLARAPTPIPSLPNNSVSNPAVRLSATGNQLTNLPPRNEPFNSVKVDDIPPLPPPNIETDE